MHFFFSGLPALYMVVTVPLGFLLQNGPHYGSDAGLVSNYTTAWNGHFKVSSNIHCCFFFCISCWLRYDTHFIWAFIAPVILIILVSGDSTCIFS